jgi:RNA polymerase-binding transcription factor DksA
MNSMKTDPTDPDQMVRDARQWLLSRAAELRERLRRVGEDLSRRREPLPRDADDAAISMENDEVLQAIEETSRHELLGIERALGRLENGLFAICEQCGEEIEHERLRAVPYSTFCSRCAEKA